MHIWNSVVSKKSDHVDVGCLQSAGSHFSSCQAEASMQPEMRIKTH